MKRFILILMALCLVFSFVGCAGTNDGKSTIGDGKVDEIEASLVRVAVGASFAAKPSLVEPAQKVSCSMLEQMDSGVVIPVSGIDAAVEAECKKYGLTKMETASMLDLVALIRAKIKKELNIGDGPDLSALDEYGVVIHDLVEIVCESASARVEK